jgi:hypothetical protein
MKTKNSPNQKATTHLTQALYQHAKERIPGGVQLLSKRPEMMAPNLGQDDAFRGHLLPGLNPLGRAAGTSRNSGDVPIQSAGGISKDH